MKYKRLALLSDYAQIWFDLKHMRNDLLDHFCPCVDCSFIGVCRYQFAGQIVGIEVCFDFENNWIFAFKNRQFHLEGAWDIGIDYLGHQNPLVSLVLIVLLLDLFVDFRSKITKLGYKLHGDTSVFEICSVHFDEL